MTEINKNALDPSHIVHKIRTSETFARAQNHPEARKLTQEGRTRASIRMAANVLKEAKPSGRLTMDGHAMNITGQLTTLNESIHTLKDLEDNGASHREKITALTHIAKFNHAVKEMIDENSSLTFSEVFTFIMTMNQAINGRQTKEDTEAFSTEIRGRLVGMRHEIAVEQMLGYMHDVEYEDATIEDDLNGADIFVSLNGLPMLPLDIKASWNTAQIKKTNARLHGADANHIIWSHIDDEDFNGTFRIPADIAATKSVALHDDIEAIFRAKFAPVAFAR
jgi:phosphoribosylpyrophosphate synthetase